MSKVPVDIMMQISYHFDDMPKTCIYTNAKPEVLEELFSNWLQDQMFAKDKPPHDPSTLVERDVYTVKIGLILEDDSFCTESDTGNHAMTVGLVMDVLSRVKDITVKSLSEREL